MLRTVFLKELKYNLRNPLVYTFTLLFLLIGFFHFSNTNPSWNGLIHMGKVNRNSPYLVSNMLSTLSVISIFSIAFISGMSVLKDYKYNTQFFFFTTPLRKSDYLSGRYAGSFLSILLIFIGGIIGIITGSYFAGNGINGVYKVSTYLIPSLVFIIPNIIFISALFFAIGTLKQSTIYLYAISIVFVIYLFALQGFTADLLRNGLLENKLLLHFLSFIDPLGGNAFKMETVNWSLSLKNNQMIPLSFLFLLQRFLWTVIGILLLIVTNIKFKMDSESVKSNTDE